MEMVDGAEFLRGAIVRLIVLIMKKLCKFHHPSSDVVTGRSE